MIVRSIFYIFYLLVFRLIPICIISIGAEFILVTLFNSFDRQLLAGFFICIMSGAINSVIISLFERLDYEKFIDTKKLVKISALLFAVGFIAPPLTGFKGFSIIYFISAIIASALLQKEFKSGFNKLE